MKFDDIQRFLRQYSVDNHVILSVLADDLLFLLALSPGNPGKQKLTHLEKRRARAPLKSKKVIYFLGFPSDFDTLYLERKLTFLLEVKDEILVCIQLRPSTRCMCMFLMHFFCRSRRQKWSRFSFQILPPLSLCCFFASSRRSYSCFHLICARGALRGFYIIYDIFSILPRWASGSAGVSRRTTQILL